jgi:hypothetical protein
MENARLRQRRSAKRQSLAIETTVRHGPFEQSTIRVEDLSFTGFAGSCLAPLRPGSFISLALPEIGLVRAKVVWTRAGKVGGKFLKPVDVRRCFPDLSYRAQPA